MPGIYFGKMNDKIKQLLATAEKVDGISKIKWRIENREYLRKQRKLELKKLMENDQQNSIDWLIEKFYNNEGMITTKQLEQAREMYHDEIEALIIKQCAEQSTSEAHKKEIHRQQIIQTYIDAKMERNIVKKHFAYFLKLERVTDKAEQYYNENYNL
jgi:hypothetical protein